MDLFLEGKPFWKGNLHCHTTSSDGLLSIADAAALYSGLGYEFLAVTDHRRLSSSGFTEGGMLLLSGIELDYTLPTEALHIVGIGMDEDYTYSRASRLDPQAAIDDLRAHGGRAILAHPAWSLNTLATLSSLRNITAAEIYNTTSTYPWNGDRADSSLILDIAAAHGVPYRFVASDDSHYYQGDAGFSFTIIQADTLSRDALLKALDDGRFYASQGPRFQQITVKDGMLSIRCTPVDTVIFYSNLVWVEERCITQPNQTEASYNLYQNPGEIFLRCQIIDRDGKSAWSNPILFPLPR